MARTNINILGISELRWIRMGEFNSDDHYIYYCRQESLRMSSPHTQKESKMQYLVTISTMTKWSLFISKANHLTQVYAHITNTKESEVEWFYENLQGILGEGNGTPLQCSCLQNPRDGGAWWAAVYGVAQSRTRLKQLSRSSTRHSRTNTKKRCPFHHRRLECKSRKSRDTWNNRQVWP